MSDANHPRWGGCNGFYPDGNIVCDDADVDDAQIVGDVTYTKRERAQITPDNAATTCTSGITDMNRLFNASDVTGADTFNGDISHWDTSDVTDMNRMFRNAGAFNQDIGAWDTSQVANMTAMFQSASAFNQNIGSWNTGNVMMMNSMFQRATLFNQDLTGWCMQNIPMLPNDDFASDSALTTAHYPPWGTCPTP